MVDAEALAAVRWWRWLLVALMLAPAVARPPGATSAGTAKVFLPMAPGPATPRSSYWGVAACCGQDAITAPAAEAQLARAAAGWTRVGIAWAAVEPTPGTFDWSSYDRLLAEIARQRIRMEVVLNGAPTWASDSYAGNGPLRPGMLPAWLRFVQAAVSRYSAPPYEVHYWEPYNEPDGRPDVPSAVGQWGYDAAGYAALLKATYPVVHAADPRGQVVVSPAYDWFNDDDPNGMFVRDWLDQVVDPARGNAGSAFDVFGLHMYTFYRSVWDPYGRDVIGKARYLRGLLARYGVAKPMMLNEFGASAGAYGSPDFQARYVVQGTVRALAAGNQIAIWFALVDFDEWKRGILDTSYQPHPATGAAAVMNAELVDPVYRGELSARQAVPPDVEGYYFDTPTGEVLVVWVDDEGDAGATRTIALAGSAVRAVDRDGVVKRIVDADDGKLDGRVALTLTREPLFVRVAP
ncbi:MAG TPA: hypothetical protein VFC93_03810 [Chloroflexota bacterium]|nr:hypothetical protein [Chloroflexota bacterium]